jgi:protein-disulfide isomerase
VVRISGVRVALLLLPALVAGCAGEGLFSASGLPSDDLPTSGSATGSAANASAPEGATKTAQSGFNPFDTPMGPPPSERVVIEHPTEAQIMKTGSLPEMAFGRPNAPVTIVQYASLTCPYCRRFHKETFPKLKKEFIDTGKVRYILREFPIGKTSGAATVALRCAKPEKYLELYGKFLAQQPAWVSQEVRLDPIFKVASQVGMTRAQFDACRENQAMISGLKWVKDRGRTLGIIGTPNFFVGGTLVKKVLTIEEIRAMVRPLLSARATAEAGKSD